MKDTPEHVKALQLKIWLSRSPMERLKQMMVDNEALNKFWSSTNKVNGSSEALQIGASDNPEQPPRSSTR